MIGRNRKTCYLNLLNYRIGKFDPLLFESAFNSKRIFWQELYFYCFFCLLSQRRNEEVPVILQMSSNSFYPEKINE